MTSHLGQLVREAREALGWSQDQLRDRLHLARPISISKWERGESPVPVHHWLDLMAILKIPRARFLEAAHQDQHRQLPIFLSLSQSVHDSTAEIGSFTWEFIIKNIAPEYAARIEQLRDRYRDLTAGEFVRAAFQHFAQESGAGLDRNNQPIRLAPEQVQKQQPPLGNGSGHKSGRSTRQTA